MWLVLAPKARNVSTPRRGLRPRPQDLTVLTITIGWHAFSGTYHGYDSASGDVAFAPVVALLLAAPALNADDFCGASCDAVAADR